MIETGYICPLFFSPAGKYPFGQSGDYTQRFYKDDHILLQIITNGGETVSGTLKNHVSGQSSSISFSTYEHNDSVKVYYKDFSGLDDSLYSVIVDDIGESEPFLVCSSSQLTEETIRIRYSHKDNNSDFNNIFWINDTQQFFDFRVEGGFKPNGFLPVADTEQYRNQRMEIVELYTMPYEQWQLTIGGASGVPIWYLSLINKILSVSHVEIGGKLYVRSETSVPQPTQVMDDSVLFNGLVTLEPRVNEVAGIGGMPESPSASSVVGFSITNPKDGQMLQYNEDLSAFENVTTVEV